MFHSSCSLEVMLLFIYFIMLFHEVIWSVQAQIFKNTDIFKVFFLPQFNEFLTAIVSI